MDDWMEFDFEVLFATDKKIEKWIKKGISPFSSDSNLTEKPSLMSD